MADLMDSRAREVVKMGDKLFAEKQQFDSLCQELALNVFCERADFTDERNFGEEYNDHQFSSYPSLARRELANMMSSHLRPQGQPWFEIHVDDEELDNENQVRAYCEYLTSVTWKAMYDSRAKFVRATKQADHDFATFGNAVKLITPNSTIDGLLYRHFHLRDNAWSENADGEIDLNHRRWGPTARQLKTLFPNKISNEVKRACQTDPDTPFECRHVILPSRVYDYKSKGGKQFPFVSLYVECESEAVLEEVGRESFDYVISRWMTMPGSAYGRSMAADIALPDSRTLQVVTRTLREAAEKHVDPPMIAVGDAIRSDLGLYAGGVTNVDAEYDERLGEVLRPITRDKSGFPIGAEVAQQLREDIRNAFFLDKIQLPELNANMTAFEVRRRIQEMVRSQSPLFEPIEKEDNEPICEKSFMILEKYRTFQMPRPPQLRDKSIRFRFRNPLSDMAEQNEAEIYKQAMAEIWMPAAQIDPAQLANLNLTTATRDAARAMGWKAKWFNDERAVEQQQKVVQEQQAAQQEMMAAGQIAEIADKGGKGIKAMAGAMNGAA